MKKNVKYLARKNTFIEFFSESLDNNKESEIIDWIQKHLIDKNPEVDYETKVGFFEAERELMRIYLEENNIDKIKQLFKVFNNFDNEGLNRIEFKMVTDVLKEKKDILVLHPEHHSDLKDILNSAFNKLTNNSEPDFKTRFDEVQALFSDVVPSTLLALLGEGASSSSTLE